MAEEFHVVDAIQDDCTLHYSPTVLRDPGGGFYHMWTGGWRNCAERNSDGNDKIFHAVSQNLADWTFDPSTVLSSVDLHLNDPTVVLVPDPGTACAPGPVFLMFLTGCGDDCFAVGGNKVYGSSSCNGVTWSSPELVIGTSNGYNLGGAWSPSAIKLSDSLLYVYFHDHWGAVLRSTFNPQASFFLPIGPPELILAGYHVNVGVTRTPTGVFELLYDSGSPFEISRMISDNGKDFRPDATFPTISGAGLVPPYAAFTGHQYIVDATSYWLFFGWGEARGPSSPQGWKFRRAQAR